jgi:hypothetical protein
MGFAFGIVLPFAGTVNEIDRPCPQSGDWPYLAEASGMCGAGDDRAAQMSSTLTLLPCWRRELERAGGERREMRRAT